MAVLALPHSLSRARAAPTASRSTGADLPFLLIFAGVIGGLLAFGVIGLFIGPVLLAVTYTLLVAWLDMDDPGAAPAPRDLSRGQRTPRCSRRMRRTSSIVAGVAWVEWLDCTTASDSTPSMCALS